MAPSSTRNGSKNNLASIREKLSADGKLIVSAISTEIEIMRNEFNDKLDSELVKMREEFAVMIGGKNEEIETLAKDLVAARESIANLGAKLSSLSANMDEGDAYQRRDTLIFSGSDIPSSESNENCSQIIKNIVKDKLHLQLDPTVSTAHRLGKPPINVSTDSPDKRPIIVKLCQRDSKNQIYSAARTMKLRGLFVNESLTPTRRSILYALRQIKRSHPDLVNGCSSYDGKVFACTKPSRNAPLQARNVRHEINTQERLKTFCVDFIQQPLENFLNSRPV